MRTYGQFCPVALAAEIFAERWTPLIVRELFCGSRRFNELEHGLPRISRSLLAQRLKALESAGIVQRRGVEYHLSQAGIDLGEIVVRLGEWGQRWVSADVTENLDPELLMWDIHRRIHIDRLPEERVVVRFDLTGTHERRYWLILERPEPSVCWNDPGFEVDLVVTADTVALHRLWMGQLDYPTALRKGLLALDGPADLRRAFPSWLALSLFAGITPAR